MTSLARWRGLHFYSLLAGSFFFWHLSSLAAANTETLFVATPLTRENAFTEGIEGPACDAQGNIYAVNFARQQTIGKVTPTGEATVFVELPGKSVGNGIRFGREGMMFVADYIGH